MKSHLRTTTLFGKGPSYSALFHSTPAALHRRRNSSNTRFHNYSGRFQREYINVCTDSFFKRWEANVEDEPSTSRGDSWHRENFTTGASSSRRHGRSTRSAWGEYAHRFEYYWDDAEDTYDDIEDTYDDIGDTFRSDFGGPQFSYWSFTDEPRWSSFEYHYRSNWHGKSHYKDGYSRDKVSDMNSDRLALGLNASGPLHLEDVKNAYRSCALKWHPDRHQGSSKAVAEEKFKRCSAAYQSLCEKLTPV